MEKPISMSVKEWIIKKMAINMVISEKVIDAVVVAIAGTIFPAINLVLSLSDSEIV